MLTNPAWWQVLLLMLGLAVPGLLAVIRFYMRQALHDYKLEELETQQERLEERQDTMAADINEIKAQTSGVPHLVQRVDELFNLLLKQSR